MPQPAAQIVGRAAELRSLDEAIAQLERRRSGVLEVVGEPGMGKTRLLAELVARASLRGHLALAGSASELEGELPFWVFVDALDEYLQGLEPHRLDGLGDDARADLASVFPALRDARSAPEAERFRTHRATRRLLEVLATTKPLVLILDDLHWADAGSLELLGALLRRPPDGAVLLALAVRPRQVPERLSAALERAARGGGLTRLDLRALTAEEAGELLGPGHSAADAAALHEQSGGNPFYLQQLARAPRGPSSPGAVEGVSLAGVEVPRAVAAALMDELGGLPADARRLLEGAAVAGDPFEPELAAAAAGLADASAIGKLDELLRRDLVRATEVPRRFRFRHPLVRGAVYEAAPGGWRLGAHERSARLLAAQGVPAVERAHHVERSARHGDLAAVAVLREAGEALAPRAPATAAQRFDAALRLLASGAPERAALLPAKAQASWAAGHFCDAYDALRESLALLPDEALAARVKLTATCAGIEHLLGRHEEGHARLEAALDALPGLDSGEAVELMIHLAMDGFYRMDYGAMRAWSSRALEVARPLGDRPLTACAAGNLAFASVLDGAVAEARAAAEEATALVDALSDDELAGRLQLGGDSLAAAQLYLGAYDAASAHAERVLAVARATGQGQLVPVLFWAGTIRTLCGRLAEAAEVLDTAIEICRVSGHDSTLAWNLYGRSFAATAAGDVETALSTAEESAELLSGGDEALPAAWAGFALASALLPAGDPARAVAVLVSAGGGDELPRFPAVWRAGCHELLARCWLALGRRVEAERSAASAQAWAEALDLAMPRAKADRAAAEVALERGDARGAVTRALASAVTAEELGAPVEGALSRVLAARALVRAGEPERAAAELQRAAAALDARGAVRHRDDAERALRRLGHRRPHRRSRPGNAAGDGVELLTERELQVARLVVDRKTNTEIAAELFLSRKTVETHLRNLFHKLEVSSRVEVARAVERADRAARR